MSCRLASVSHWRTAGVSGKTRRSSGPVKAAYQSSVRAEVSSSVRVSKIKGLGATILCLGTR